MSKKKNESVIDKATGIYFSNDNRDLLTYLTPHIDKYPINDNHANKKFNQLLALGYVIQEKLIDAEKHCNDCIAIEPNELDYYYVLSYVHLKMQEFDNSIKNSELYLSLYKKTNSSKTSITSTSNHKCQIHIFLGNAYQEIGDYEKAINQFKDAIKEEKDNQLPYLQLVNLYINTNENTLAKQTIQDGINNCSQIQELRLLEKSLDSGNLKLNSENYALIEIQADLFKNEGNYDKALQHYEALLHVEPNNVELLYALSECYLLMGYEDSAVLGLKRILELNPNYKSAQDKLDSLSKQLMSH